VEEPHRRRQLPCYQTPVSKRLQERVCAATGSDGTAAAAPGARHALIVAPGPSWRRGRGHPADARQVHPTRLTAVSGHRWQRMAVSLY